MFPRSAVRGRAGWRGKSGRVDDLVRKYADQWSLDADSTTAYLCGHPAMIDHGKAILHRHGWEQAAIKQEIYFARVENAAA